MIDMQTPQTRHKHRRNGHRTLSVLSVNGHDCGDVAALLFDKDGTLIDFDTYWLHWLRLLVEALQRALPDDVHLDDARALQMLGVTPDYRHCDPCGPLTIGSMADIAALLSLCLYENGLPWNDALRLVNTGIEQTLEQTDTLPVVAKPSLRALVKQAEGLGIPLAVVTSDTSINAQRHLQAMNLEQAFAVVLGHDDAARGKPFPDLALQACDLLGVSPGRAALFGDSNGDMQMARSAGLAAAIGVCADTNNSHHLQAADYIIDDFKAVALRPVA